MRHLLPGVNRFFVAEHLEQTDHPARQSKFKDNLKRAFAEKNK
jgi:hypothetical protein